MAAEPGSSSRQEPLQEPTGLPLATLQWVGRSICSTPPGFTLHPELERLFQARRCGCFSLPLCTHFDNFRKKTACCNCCRRCTQL